MPNTGTIRKCPTSGADIDLWYDTVGDLSNPAILFIMGLNGQAVIWDPNLLQMFADAGFCCIILDNRDVGLSCKIENKPAPSLYSVSLLPKWLAWFEHKLPYTLEDMADDCAALLDYLKIRKAAIMGTSMGGMIAQQFAIRHTDRCTALISVYSSTGGSGLPGMPFWAKWEFSKAPKSNSPEDLIEIRVQVQRKVLQYGAEGVHVFDENYCRGITTRAVKRSAYTAGMQRHSAAVMRQTSREPMLKKLTVPTLVVHGDKDAVISVECGRRTASCIPGAKMLEIKGMSHLMMPGVFELIVKEVTSLIKEKGKL